MFLLWPQPFSYARRMYWSYDGVVNDGLRDFCHHILGSDPQEAYTSIIEMRSYEKRGQYRGRFTLFHCSLTIAGLGIDFWLRVDQPSVSSNSPIFSVEHEVRVQFLTFI